MKLKTRYSQHANVCLITFYMQHGSELQSAHEEVAKNTSEARELYNYLLESSIRTTTQLVSENITELNHSQAIIETQKEVDIIMEQVSMDVRPPGHKELVSEILNYEEIIENSIERHDHHVK